MPPKVLGLSAPVTRAVSHFFRTASLTVNSSSSPVSSASGYNKRCHRCTKGGVDGRPSMDAGLDSARRAPIHAADETRRFGSPR